MNAETGDFDFKPWGGTGATIKKSEKKKGDSTFYETEGEKQSSYIAHLKVSKDADDPVGEMFDQLQYLTKTMVKAEPKQPKSRAILDQEKVKVWYRKDEGKVIVRMEIDNAAKSALSLSTQLFNLTQEVNKCFAINKAQLER